MICVGSHWRAWHNPFPYSGHDSHIMLAPLAHFSQPGELIPEAWGEWGMLVSALIERFELPGGGLVMRFGENSHNGGSLTHLHSHIQVPDKTGYAIAVFFADDRLKAFFKG